MTRAAGSIELMCIRARKDDDAKSNPRWDRTQPIGSMFLHCQPKTNMTESQELNAAHAIIGLAHQLLADMGGVLPDDFHASTTAIIWHALELQLGGPEKVGLLLQRD